MNEAKKDCVAVVEQRREEYGMTIKALARKSGIEEAVLYNILSRRRRMQASEMIALSAVLGLTLDDYREAGESA